MKFQTSAEVLTFFDQFRVTAIDLTLSRMEQALAILGNPHEAYQTLHIGGTNGKGSTTSFLRNMLQAHGYKVATFTSPHIETFHERMQLSGTPITDAELLRVTNEVFHLLGQQVEQLQLTQFELMTLVMFYYFATIKPDFAIIEVGMGGCFDATNVITPLVSVITNVSLDHQSFLGSDVLTIAEEKAGIIKLSVPFVTTAQDERVLEVLVTQAHKQQAPTYRIGHEFKIITSQLELEQTQITYQFADEKPQTVTIFLKGYHQVENASAAMTVMYILAQQKYIELDGGKLRLGLAKTTWPGRMEQLAAVPETYVDGAHNEAGISQLCQTIPTYFANRRCHVIFSAMADKDVALMIPQLEAVATTVTLTSFAFPRAATAQHLLRAATQPTTQAVADCLSAYEQVKASAQVDDVIILTGSLYFVAHVREMIRNY